MGNLAVGLLPQGMTQCYENGCVTHCVTHTYPRAFLCTVRRVLAVSRLTRISSGRADLGRGWDLLCSEGKGLGEAMETYSNRIGKRSV